MSLQSLLLPDQLRGYTQTTLQINSIDIANDYQKSSKHSKLIRQEIEMLVTSETEQK